MSPLPAATNGMPPKISGFHSGKWPLRLNHSALQLWNGTPEISWSLHGLASHFPASIGSDSRAGQIASAADAHSVGRRGSNGVACVDSGTGPEFARFGIRPTPVNGPGAGT